MGAMVAVVAVVTAAAGCSAPLNCTGEAAASAACRGDAQEPVETGGGDTGGNPSDASDQDVVVPFDVPLPFDVTADASGGDATTPTDASAPDGACVPNCTGRTCGPDGCGGTCAPNMCGRGLTCNSVDGVCEPNAGAMWQITVLDGTVSMTNPRGGDWDNGLTATMQLPDPYVCVGRSGMAMPVCAPTIDNTIAPSWAFRVSTVFSTADLLGGVMINAKDNDGLSADDDICPVARVMITASQIARGRFVAGCASAMINFRVDPM